MFRWCKWGSSFIASVRLSQSPFVLVRWSVDLRRSFFAPFGVTQLTCGNANASA